MSAEYKLDTECPKCGLMIEVRALSVKRIQKENDALKMKLGMAKSTLRFYADLDKRSALLGELVFTKTVGAKAEGTLKELEK